jgi:CHAT domain-containing protein/tetratricopeptide (TPR) repeat protein
MKSLCSLLFACCVTGLGMAQVTDSAFMVRQVQSMIAFNRILGNKNKQEASLQIIEAAAARAKAAFGANSTLYARTLHAHGRTLQDTKSFPEAEICYKKALTIRENTIGKDHRDYAETLNSLSNLYYKIKRYDEAENLGKEAIACYERVTGKDNLLYENSIFNLACIYFQTKRFTAAAPLFLEAKAIYAPRKGKENKHYTAILQALSFINIVLGNFGEAEAFILEAKAIDEKVYGKESQAYATDISVLSSLYYQMGRYAEAAALNTEMRTLKENMQQAAAEENIDQLASQAIDYYLADRYNEAEPLFLKMLALLEKTKGKDNARYAACLDNLATLYTNTGRYEKAEPLYLEAIAITEKLAGKMQTGYITYTNNLAVLYSQMGLYHKSESLYLEVISIREKIIGKEDPKSEKHLFYLGEPHKFITNLAGVYHAMGLFEKALPLYLDAKAILESEPQGEEHPDYALLMTDLASLYLQTGQEEAAERMYLKAKSLYEKKQGQGSQYYAMNQMNLATLYMKKYLYESAEPLLMEAKEIIDKVQGKDHPFAIMIMSNLANLYAATSRLQESETLYLEIQQSDKAAVHKGALYLSENELSAYIKLFVRTLDNFMSFTSRQYAGSPHLVSACYDNALFHKGFILQTVGQMRRLIEMDTTATHQSAALTELYRRLEKQYSLPLDKRDSTTVATLKNQANRIEKEMVRSVSGYSEMRKEVTWQEVQSKLKPGEAAIEFVNFQYYGTEGFPADSIFYAALLILPDITSPIYLPLFEESAVQMLLNNSGKDQAGFCNEMYSAANRGLTPSGKPVISEKIYAQVWAPVEAVLSKSSVHKIYFAPAGILHQINLNAIPRSPGGTLADRYQLVQLTSTRELVMPDIRRANNNNAFLYGGIEYNRDTASIALANAGLTDTWSARSRGEWSFNSTDSTLRSDTWEYLPFTKTEVETVGSILEKAGIPVEISKGYAATEEAFKYMGYNHQPSPRILHIATHGFFFPDPEKQKTTPVNDDALAYFKISEEPMIRSGLILAGGNDTWLHKTGTGTGEDGILTAYEISHLNLQHTELVVLSACETGLGEIKGNEGVYGLQRAFKIAGVKYLIMSLWQVPDQQTAELMAVFYQKWLEDKMEIPEAFRAAQQEMRQRGLDPYSWAGFVLVE